MHPPLRLTFANKIVLGKIHWKINGLICLNVFEFQYAIWIMELHHIHDSLHAPSNFNGQPSLIQTLNSIALFVKHLMVCTEPATNTLEFSLIRYKWLPDICQYHIFTTLTRIKDRAIFVKPSIIEKHRRKKGNDYYQTIVKHVSKIKVPGTTAEKV